MEPALPGRQRMAINTPASSRVHADAGILNLSRRLATVDVSLWQREETNLVAQATVGYALPG